MRRFPVFVQQVVSTSGLAVQKSRANRNTPQVSRSAIAGLAVQKSRANRNKGVVEER